jgi:CubicO group peptidase (beta-lactamase class C family)
MVANLEKYFQHKYFLPLVYRETFSMKPIFKTILIIAAVLTLTVGGVYVSGNGYLLKGLWASYLHGHKSASIGDAQFFDTRIIAAGNNKQPWNIKSDYNQQPLSAQLKNILESTNSVAFLLIQNDSIVSEHYWDGYTDRSHSNSFSMAKSITTMLAQIAIQKGVLQGWNQKVKTLLPELKGKYADSLELWHLSTMSAGLLWSEKYTNPFSITAKAYYGSDVAQLMMQLPIDTLPGKKYNYQSGATQLLGMCIMAATKKPLATLASEWLWQPLQAEQDAMWHTDAEGTELAYCCFNSNARDFARFGKMLLQRGTWNNAQILDSAFVDLATSPALDANYGYSFWLNDEFKTPVFYMRGILGQYIIVLPEYNAVAVRLGHERINPQPGEMHTKEFKVIVEEALKMVAN